MKKSAGLIMGHSLYRNIFKLWGQIMYLFGIGLWSLAGNAWSVLRGPRGVYNVPRTRWWCLAAPAAAHACPPATTSTPKSMKSNDTQWKSIKYHWFSLIFIDFHWFPLISNDFHWFSLIFIDFHRFWVDVVAEQAARTAGGHAWAAAGAARHHQRVLGTL